MKEKLIELVKRAIIELDYGDAATQIAYHLIANGVTVQKKGEWKWEYIVTHGVAEKKAVCSLCGVPNKQYKPPYCPHCGAKMDVPKDGDT